MRCKMLALRQILWIILLLYIDFLLPQGCKAAVITKEIWMKNDVDGHDRFALKPARRLLNWENTDEHNTIIFIIVSAIVVVIAILIKCCIRLASEGAEDTAQINTVHPPPRQIRPPTQPTYGTRRSLAPPMTSNRSLILLPEETYFQAIFIGIENPNYIPPTNNSSQQERRNSNPTPLLDLPPDYDSVVKSDSHNSKSENVVNIPNVDQKDFASLPKYEDTQKRQ